MIVDVTFSDSEVVLLTEAIIESGVKDKDTLLDFLTEKVHIEGPNLLFYSTVPVDNAFTLSINQSEIHRLLTNRDLFKSLVDSISSILNGDLKEFKERITEGTTTRVNDMSDEEFNDLILQVATVK